MDQIKIGNFLKELRKEKSLTQEQLAEQFNVSNRTVSRWENGNNMPDLSILVELAEFYGLDIHELIDGERKNGMNGEHIHECDERGEAYTDINEEKMDEALREPFVDTSCEIENYKGIKQKRMSFIIGEIILGVLCIPLLVCLIVNLSVSHTLDWFFIVLTALMTAASLTSVPLMVRKKKGLFTILSFTSSLLLLLLTCSIIVRGKWFLTAGTSVIFSLSVVFMPYIAYELPMPDFFKRNKGLFALVADTALFVVMMYCIGISLENADVYWEVMPPIAFLNAAVVWIVFLICRYLKTDVYVRAGIVSIIIGVICFIENSYVNMILGQRFDMPKMNFNDWHSGYISGNISWLILIVSMIVSFICIMLGFGRKSERSDSSSEI